jgi:hypothetical protein
MSHSGHPIMGHEPQKKSVPPRNDFGAIEGPRSEHDVQIGLPVKAHFHALRIDRDICRHVREIAKDLPSLDVGAVPHAPERVTDLPQTRT